MTTKPLQVAPPEVKLRDTKYRKVLDHFYAEIHSGRWQPGIALPTDLDLSQRLGMSRNTIRHAFDKLVQEGIVYRVPGRGTFVTTDQQRQSRQQLDVFALVAPELGHGGYPALIQGFEKSCAGCSHQTLVSSSGNNVDRQANLFMQLIDQSVGGVAVVPTTTVPPTPPHQIRQLQKNQVPVVLCHRTVEGIKAPSVVFSGFEIGLKAGRKLLDFGHRRVLMLYVRRYSMTEERERGLRQAFVDAGVDPKGVVSVGYGEENAAPDPHSEAAIQAALSEHFRRPDRPTAVFCGNSPDAEVVYLYAQSLGLQIPRDLSLLFFGNNQREHGLAGRISAITVAESEIGATAARLLFEMRMGKRPLESDEQIVFPITELPGETLGPAPGIAAQN